MYKEFFNFNCKPFDLVPNPEFLFLSHSHQKAINYLRYGIQERAGFLLFTGEVGSGKTTIVRDLIRKVDLDTVVSMVFNTRVDARQLLEMINEDFNLDVEGKDKRALLRDLNDFLIEQHAKSGKPIIIIDEAQNLCSEALEEIRMISNLETDNSKLVQIILVGQPELKNLINNPALRQLRQRIGVNCHLDPLNRDEAEAYVFHRLEVAGNRDAVNFDSEAFDVIYTYSSGVPRLINVFCDFILLAAYAENTKDLTKELVEDVVGDVAWKEGAAAVKPNAPFAADGENNSIAQEIFRKLSFIENNMVKVANVADQLAKLQKKEKNFESLFQAFERQNEQLQKLAKDLNRIKETVTLEIQEKQVDNDPVINFKNGPRQKQGIFSRIFG